MIILGLFLIHLAEFVAAFAFIEWLVHWLDAATMTEAVVMFSAALGAVATMVVLVAHGRGGVIIAVVVILFWSLVIFGAAGTTAINILALAGAVLVVAASVVLVESFMVRWRAAQNPS